MDSGCNRWWPGKIILLGSLLTTLFSISSMWYFSLCCYLRITTIFSLKMNTSTVSKLWFILFSASNIHPFLYKVGGGLEHKMKFKGLVKYFKEKVSQLWPKGTAYIISTWSSRWMSLVHWAWFCYCCPFQPPDIDGPWKLEEFIKSTFWSKLTWPAAPGLKYWPSPLQILHCNIFYNMFSVVNCL